MLGVVRAVRRFVKPNPKQDNLLLKGKPGLMTVLDVALYQTYEAELTATVTSAHSLLHAWLDLKKQAIRVLNAVRSEETVARDIEVFAKLCLDSSCEAVEKLVKDPFAQSSACIRDDPAALEPLQNKQDQSKEQYNGDTARRVLATRLDSTECDRLYCPDYVWADQAFSTSQRLLRQLLKSQFISLHLEDPEASLPTLTGQEARVLALVVTADLPARLVQFKTSMETNSAVSKRLYLVKSEYRTPFRHCMEAHLALQRAPSLHVVNEFIQLPKSKATERRKTCKERLQQLLSTPHLVEALALEQKADEFETSMAKALFPFSELARFLDQKKAHLVPTNKTSVTTIRETLRRLKGVLCRRAGTDSSTGIRPVLLDLQGVRRDEEKYGSSFYFSATTDDPIHRLDSFVQQLATLGELARARGSFRAEKRGDFDIPVSIIRGCNSLDRELFSCHFQDWFAITKRQHFLTTKGDFTELAQKIRQAEVELSLAGATSQSLDVVRERLEGIESDREKRFRTLHETVEEVCLREMNLQVAVEPPAKHAALTLKPTSALGVFGSALQHANEQFRSF